MAAKRDWWNHGNVLLDAGPAPRAKPQPRPIDPYQHANLPFAGPAVHITPRGVVQSVDHGGNEIFSSARRAGGLCKPQASEPPFGSAAADLMVLSPHNKNLSTTPPSAFFGGKRSYGGGGQRDPSLRPIERTWRTGDDTPLTIGDIAPSPRLMPSSMRKVDPVLAGYGSQGTAGYGKAFLFPSRQDDMPQAASLDLQVAAWRLTNASYDPHPFTLDGEVPAPSPRRSPRRQAQPDLMMQVYDPKDNCSVLEAHNELRRRTNNMNTLDGTPSFPPPDSTPREARKHGGSWRNGDAHPLTFDGSIIPRRETNPTIDSAWRMPDKCGVSFTADATPNFTTLETREWQAASLLAPPQRRRHWSTDW